MVVCWWVFFGWLVLVCGVFFNVFCFNYFLCGGSVVN